VETDFLEDENGDVGEDGSGKHLVLLNSFPNQNDGLDLLFKANHLFIVYTSDRKHLGFL